MNIGAGCVPNLLLGRDSFVTVAAAAWIGATRILATACRIHVR
jgi:hypothetical protein